MSGSESQPHQGASTGQAMNRVESTAGKVVRFEEIAGDQMEVMIDNQGVMYRLRRTKLGKLILTK